MILRAINQDCEPHRIVQPSSNDLGLAIQALDGKTRTLLTLEVNGDHYMAVGGGGTRYVVYMTLDNRRFKNLVIAGKTGPKVGRRMITDSRCTPWLNKISKDGCDNPAGAKAFRPTCARLSSVPKIASARAQALAPDAMARACGEQSLLVC